jgi:hypothetical protein
MEGYGWKACLERVLHFLLNSKIEIMKPVKYVFLVDDDKLFVFLTKKTIEATNLKATSVSLVMAARRLII